MGGGGSMHDPFDIFQSFFGRNPFGGGSSRGRRQRMGEDVIHPLRVSLEDLYSGTSKKLSLSRNVICSKCNGKGSKSGASTKCAGCQGTGMKFSIRHLGPSMIQQMQHPCKECKATGETINEKDSCPQWKGEKVIQEKKVLEVMSKRGCKMGRRSLSPGRLMKPYAIHPVTVTGDIVFVLQQKDHSKFKRKGDDLFYEHAHSLTEALCGFKFVLTHLDGRQLLIKSNPREVVKPDQFKAIDDEGMPIYQRPFMNFTVEFPKSRIPFQLVAAAAHTSALAGWMASAAASFVQAAVSILKHPRTPPATLGTVDYHSPDHEQLMKRSCSAQSVEKFTNITVSFFLVGLVWLCSWASGALNPESSPSIDNVSSFKSYVTVCPYALLHLTFKDWEPIEN
ncbi:hypothetical protein Nepgr_033780 [Nepenthes gracilis]|uniref:CR-type domain-containing protein n=1 Tax=Nepenthes gracilis TaxID=150966 RepID=A0AAD3Y950_NEPGR|nr:hypothetical protein Nepgr_033780 [Nepenthes gracilis]